MIKKTFQYVKEVLKQTMAQSVIKQIWYENQTAIILQGAHCTGAQTSLHTHTHLKINSSDLVIFHMNEGKKHSFEYLKEIIRLLFVVYKCRKNYITKYNNKR